MACDLARDLPTVPYRLGSEADLEETADAVRAAGRRCLPVRADAASLAQMEEAVARAAEPGALDVVCANAGVISFGRCWAAKHGVIGLMRSLAIELAPHGIRVNCVLPGGVRTPMGTAGAMHDWLAAEPDASRALTALLPVDLVEPDDVSAAVTWLASDGARLVTGVALPVDAGVQLR